MTAKDQLKKLIDELPEAIDGEVFPAFTQNILASALHPGDVLVMDNLSVHKVKGVVEAVEAAGARVLFLRPYSPDFNPIEQCWAKSSRMDALPSRSNEKSPG